MTKLLTILTLLFCITSFAQKSDSLVTVKGVAWDVGADEFIPFVNIYLCIEDSVYYKTQTDYYGKYELKIDFSKIDNLRLIASYLGMIKEKKEILIDSLNEIRFQTKSIICTEIIYENAIINPHEMSTGIIYRDGEFESIK